MCKLLGRYNVYSGTHLIRTLLGQKKVLISGVEKYSNMVLGEEESVLFREVSLFLVEGFHCI